MGKWLQRIFGVAAVIIALELIAWVGIVLLGPDAMHRLITFYNPGGDATSTVVDDLPGGAEQKCSTYRGEVFCITEARRDSKEAAATIAASAPTENESQSRKKCADFQGETICIEEGS